MFLDYIYDSYSNAQIQISNYLDFFEDISYPKFEHSLVGFKKKKNTQPKLLLNCW